AENGESVDNTSNIPNGSSQNVEGKKRRRSPRIASVNVNYDESGEESDEEMRQSVKEGRSKSVENRDKFCYHSMEDSDGEIGPSMKKKRQ
ncbi:hypothetical protein PMAYCL1PPCAC_14220, partial [Pristionchus mayeri]